MKQRLIIVFFLCLFISCAEEDPIWKLTGVEVRNMNNEGEFPVVSDDSIRKEAYALDILYLGKNIDDNSDYSRVDFKNSKDTLIEQKIFCIGDLSLDYPSGSDVTELFKPIFGNTADVSNLDTKFHGGTFILRYIPDPGMHSFHVCVYVGNGRIIEGNTVPVKLY